MNVELERILRDVLMGCGIIPTFCQKEPRKFTKNLIKASRYAGQISNQIPPEYNRKALPLQPLIRYKRF